MTTAQTPTGAVRVAGIDCGTNSIRLLVADVIDGRLTEVHREMRVVRLGEGVDATGRLSAAALERTGAALADYTRILREAGATRVRMAATSASRDAENRQEFVDLVQSVLGIAPEVITGEEEAELSFRGAVGDLDPDRGPFLVVDIGGGSTEMVVGSVGPQGPVVDGRTSLDIGCVRITERLLHSDPPTAAEWAAARSWTQQTLTAGLARLPLDRVRHLVNVSGTATTVAAAAMDLPEYDSARIHLSTLTLERTRDTASRLGHATRSQRAALPYMHPGRVDVIGGGALVLSTLVELVAERTGLGEFTVSEHDILDGLALSLA